MSIPTDLLSEPEPEPGPPTVPGPSGDGRSFVALIDHDGTEPPADLSDRDALAAWSAVTALWHPALLARADALPRTEGVATPSAPGPREIRTVAAGAAGRLPSGYRTQAEDAGCPVFEAEGDRAALVRAVRERLGAVEGPDGAEARAVADDFCALGTARWMLRDLTVAMGHADFLDLDNLTREVLAGAAAWQASDVPTATNRLRAAFELLTQARERFYPVDAHLVDLCLVDPATPAGALADALAARAPVTFLAPAHAIENLAGRDPEALAALRAAISEGWADVAGGSYTESDESLLPVESILWQFRRAAATYAAHLDDRHVETVARRRFALYPQLPQIARRSGFRFAIHLGFDAGRFPIRPEPKRLWEAPDGSTLEALCRPPLAADRPAQGAHLPWRLALTMKDDHVATLPLVHWPGAVAPWYRDLRRVAAYSPVLARWVTLNDYFHLTDRPYETFRPEPDAYVTPYLAQAVARRDRDPISRRAAHARLRARLGAAETTLALASAVMLHGPGVAAHPGRSEGIETDLETGRLDEARAALETSEPDHAQILARAIVGHGTSGRSGYLVLNPLGVARRVAVILPDAALDLRPEGPLRAAQFTDEGVWAVVDLPAFGYAWVPREPNVELPPATSGGLSGRDRVLRNESMAVEIDAGAGGIRSVHGVKESVARLGQQLAVAGLVGPDGKPAASRMHAGAIEVEYAGPALVQAVARGSVLDPRGDRRIASFVQRYRLWSGRPILEIDITLDDLDPAWLDRIAQEDPWAHFLGCRWAWPDDASVLRRTCLLAPEPTVADRPETPDALDISTRRQRTALLFGGLAHHRRHGTRMLDTLLIAGREAARTFRLGVALDLEHPFHAALDLITPAYVVPTESGPPRTGPVGWLVQADSKAVAVTRVAFADHPGEGRGRGLVVHLAETAGRASRCRLRTFRDPTGARQLDFQDELIADLSLDGDAVLIDLTPYELARIEVILG